MASNRSSGLDFSDGKASSLDNHPDMVNPYAGGAHLQRNKSERGRLQGLQRIPTIGSLNGPPPKPCSWKQKYDLWMINEGGRQLFFGAWIFLHLLVAIFGFINYQLKDNLANARATFGVGYRTFLPPLHLRSN